MAPLNLNSLDSKNGVKRLLGTLEISVGRKRGNGGNGNDSDGHGKDGDADDNRNGDDKNDLEHDSSPSPAPSSIIATTPTPTSATTLSTMSKISVVASSTQFSCASYTSGVSSSTQSSISTSLSLFTPMSISIATTTSPPQITAFIPSAVLSRPRKGVDLYDDDNDNDKDGPYGTKTNGPSNTVPVLSEIASLSTSSSLSELSEKPSFQPGGGLSPTAEHALIAFGAIGAFTIFLAVIYFFARVKKIDLLLRARGRGSSMGGSRSWYRWREREIDHTTDGPPPKYTGFDGGLEYSSEQKAIPSQLQLNAMYTSKFSPNLSTAEPEAASARGQDFQRQENIRAALMHNPMAFGFSPSQSFEKQLAQDICNPNHSFISRSTANPNTTYNSDAATAGHSRHNSGAIDPLQKELHHLSMLSSLSSGFGDQIIIPEPVLFESNDDTPAARHSTRRSRKFSWETITQGRRSDRDTLYNRASIDYTPIRFRTIHSWVAQQTGRIQNKQTSDSVPELTNITKPLQAGSNGNHARQPSEDPAFKFHPGDEVEFSKGSRIPSEILDKKFALIE